MSEPSAPKKANYRPVYVGLGIVVVIATLLTPVDAFANQGVSFIDTELKTQNDAARLYVNTKYPIGDAEKLNQFPTSLGKWNMTHEYDWDFIADLLDTDVLIARDYRAPGVYIPVSVVIIQSTNMSSFHPAPVCYKAQGFEIVDAETSTVSVPVNETQWAREGLFEGDQRAFGGTIQAKRLVVERVTEDGAVQRELNLYFYIKEEEGRITQKVEWVRISMFVPAKGDYSRHEAVLKDVMGEVVPELFAPVEKPPTTTLAQSLLSRVA